MKKYILSALTLLSVALFTTSCSSDEPSGNSIFRYEETEFTEFDQWLYDNFTKPYNIQFIYRYVDRETNNQYNVVPADPEKAKALAILIKNVWIEAYETVLGQDFIKQYGPKVYQLLGSPQYNSNGSMVLGYAENAVKITLLRVNEIDIDNLYINMTDPFRSHYDEPLDLNYWYFHTMHHEFFHILTQSKNYPTTFRQISAGHYHTADWINVEDTQAPLEGFVTGYASGEYNEDIAEIYSTYVTSTPEAWEKILELAATGDVDGTSGRDLIEQKLEIVKEYMSGTWGVDLDLLRAEVLSRAENAPNLDLRTLN